MASTGLLIVSNIKNILSSIVSIRKCVKNLYIHLNVPGSKSALLWSSEIAKIYSEFLANAHDVNISVLVSHLKAQDCCKINKPIDILFSDGKFPDICETIKKKYGIASNPVFLTDSTTHDLSPPTGSTDQEIYDTVVLGGTFDRIHVGHKILLTEAVLRACKKVVVGVTCENMIKSKRLWELILPVEERIRHVQGFLTDIDCSLEYEVVPIEDPFGPTKTDPNMDLIIVSAETYKGAQKINEIRQNNGLKLLKIYCIDMIELATDHEQKENKVSSSNSRLDLLGTRLQTPEPRPNLPREPYIIGLAGGIATGKSVMVDRFKKFGAFVLDCDKLAHELYEPGQVCFARIVDHFGNQILDEEGRINRKSLGAIVFEKPAELDALSNMIWPEIIKEATKRIYKAYEENKFKVAILEAAILHKAGWDKECHEVWSMIVDPDEAVRRLKVRNNLSEEEARKRLASQLDNKTVVSRSHVVFSSEWSHEFSQEQAARAWRLLMQELDSS